MAKKERIVSYTAEELDRMPSETDWARVDAISDEELDEIVRNDPDDLYLTEAELAEAVMIYPVDVRALRERMGLSQEAFAARFGFSVGTVRNWERGRRPEGPVQVLLQVIDREPDAVRRALGWKPEAARPPSATCREP